jgi:hypothetical protein
LAQGAQLTGKGIGFGPQKDVSMATFRLENPEKKFFDKKTFFISLTLCCMYVGPTPEST